MHCQLGQMECAVIRSGGVGKRCQNMRQEVNYLSEREEIFRGMLKDKIWMQSRATEKYYGKETRRGSATCAAKVRFMENSERKR